ADHAFAADFLLAAGGVGDGPVPGAELHGLCAGIGDDDGVGPEILAAIDRRALREEVRLGGDFDLTSDGAIHAGKLPEILFRIIAKNAGGTIAGPPGLPVVWSRFQHSSILERTRARSCPVSVCVPCVRVAGRYYLS